MLKENANRVRREGILSASETLVLPVGIQKPGEQQRFREIVVDDMCGQDEENIAHAKVRRNPSSATTVLLRRCVQEIPGLMPAKSKALGMAPAEYVRDWMTQVDRDFLLASILVLSGHDQTQVRGYCDECEESFAEPVGFGDLEIFDWPEAAPLEVYGELPRGYRDKDGNVHKEFTLMFPSGAVQEKILAQSRGNQGKASSLFLASCLTRLGDLDGLDSDITSRLKTMDRQFIGDFGQDHFPGIQLVRRISCDSCGKEYERMVDISGFFVKAWERGK